MVDNYTTGGVRYSRLSLYDLSFEDDTGNYTNTVKNQCGSSFVYIYIDVMEGRRLNNKVLIYGKALLVSLHDCIVNSRKLHL